MKNEDLDLHPPWLGAQRERMGRYVLGPLIGKGGMGEVVEAWDVLLHRTVALKVLRNMEPTAVIRFMTEARAQARVDHPNVCRVYDVETSDDTVMIAMQLVRGPNLEQAARDLSLPETVTLMAQVAEGVHAAHRQKLIHRDLKPSNILLERGLLGRWVPYICDFGLAMAMDESSFTASGVIQGTPSYMAPEQARGDRSAIGPATDVYGLGGTLHYLLLGRSPVGAPMSQGDIQIPRPEGAQPGLPRDLRNIILKSLQADPGLRYPSAALMAEDLWSFLNGEEVHATLPGPLGRIWRRIRPRVAAAMPLGLGLGGLLAGLGVAQLVADRSLAQRMGWVQAFQADSRDLEKDLAAERALPLHDLRPAYHRARARMDAIRSRMARLDRGAAAWGHLALARAGFDLRDFKGAQEEAEAARAAGNQGPGPLRCQAAAMALEAALGYGAAPAQDRIDALLRRLPAPAGDEPFDESVTAYLRGDYPKAAAEAQVALAAHPWQGEAAVLASASLCALAQAAFENGDVAGAREKFQEALDGARRFLPLAPSDELAHHAVLLAARGLAALQLDQGALDPDRLAALQAQSDQSLGLDPGCPALQDDWLAQRFLAIWRLRELGQDTGSILDAAMIFQGTRLKEPLGRALATDRMALHWLQAEQDLGRGENPDPALDEALKIADPQPILGRDLRAGILVFRAQTRAARGEDPQPDLDAALARLHPQGQGRGSWTASRTAALAWLVRAEWEAGRGLDATESLRKARTLVDGALRINMYASASPALTGLAHALEAVQPSGRNALPGLRAILERSLASF